MIIIANRLLINRARVKEQLKLEIVEKEHLKELNEAKSNFLANISHEFRTPLTLILSPVKLLLDKSSNKDDTQELNLIQKNVIYLGNVFVNHNHCI